MAKLSALCVASVLLLHCWCASAQGNFGDYDDLQQFINANNPTPATQQGQSSTTGAPDPNLQSCITSCVALPQYNPVCGTDGVSYNNPERLKCAKRCGVNVDVQYYGTCGPSPGGK